MMKSALKTVGIKPVLLLAAVSLSAAAVSQTIQNGSFESNNVTSTGYQYSSDENHPGDWWYQSSQLVLSVPNWKFSNMSGIISNGGSTPWGGLLTSDGSYYAFIQSYSGAPNVGSISQTVKGFTDGDQYILTFSAAGRPSYSANTVTVGATPGGPSSSMFFTPNTGNWQTYSLDFTATNWSETFTWTGQPLTGQSMDNDTFIDSVSLASANGSPLVNIATPGPAAAIPFLLGIAAKRRRQSKKA